MTARPPSGERELGRRGATTHLPRLLVTGASGFTGRRLLETLKGDYRIFAVARRSPELSGAPTHPNITWDLLDVGDREAVTSLCRRLHAGGGVDAVLHMAAYYDFTGEDHPEYRRTNVEGLRNVLDGCRELSPGRFIFVSSAAACEFPPPGRAIHEGTPPDAPPPYSVSKRAGEAMTREYQEHFPTCIVRFAALYSDWCEYPPLFVFLRTWLSAAWSRRILGGRGDFGVPYLHVRDVVRCLRQLLDRLDDVEPAEVFLASTDGSVPVRELFEAATAYANGRPDRVLYLPRALCALGMWARDRVGALVGQRPFERPWMARYIDRRLTVDASRTRQRLSWAPRERLMLPRRLPFLLENAALDPVQWRHRNRSAMEKLTVAPNLRIHHLLERHEPDIADEVSRRMMRHRARELPSYLVLSSEERRWNHRLALRNLMNAILSRRRGLFMAYCRDLAERRRAQDFSAAEVCAALDLLRDVCLARLRADPEAEELAEEIQHQIGVTMLFGRDAVADVFDEEADGESADLEAPTGAPPRRRLGS